MTEPTREVVERLANQHLSIVRDGDSDPFVQGEHAFARSFLLWVGQVCRDELARNPECKADTSFRDGIQCAVELIEAKAGELK